jgi:hypothetical protein
MPTFNPTSGSPPFILKRLTIDEWLAYVAAYDFGPVAPSMLVLHHTWKPTIAQWQSRASMAGMQSYYQGKGWKAGPHVYAAPDGIWLATPMHTEGIHANAFNGGRRNGHYWYSIGLEMVGDYDDERPSGAVWDASLAVIGGLSRRLNIPPLELIRFHREANPQKSCPGRAVTMAWVQEEVRAWLDGRPAAPPQASIVGIGRDYACSPEMKAAYEAHGGLIWNGFATSDEYEAPDEGGERCRWMRFENVVIKFKPSLPPEWRRGSF